MCVAHRMQHMGDKGWGLVALQPVKAGSFVIEYIGETPACILPCDMPPAPQFPRSSVSGSSVSQAVT